MPKLTGALKVYLLYGLTALSAAVQPAPVTTATLTGGGEVSIRRDGEVLRVAVKGPLAGLASLCVGDNSRVRILHASAAVGEAVYTRRGDRWALDSGFDWRLRDAASGRPAQSEIREFFDRTGWVANASRTGAGERAFRIRMAEGIRFLGVTDLSTSEPMVLSRWPAEMNDDCATVKVAQGHLLQTARFVPDRWHAVR
jgi:hypothetical protein